VLLSWARGALNRPKWRLSARGVHGNDTKRWGGWLMRWVGWLVGQPRGTSPPRPSCAGSGCGRPWPWAWARADAGGALHVVLGHTLLGHTLLRILLGWCSSRLSRGDPAQDPAPSKAGPTGCFSPFHPPPPPPPRPPPAAAQACTGPSSPRTSTRAGGRSTRAPPWSGPPGCGEWGVFSC
jgi:hypothetical protein